MKVDFEWWTETDRQHAKFNLKRVPHIGEWVHSDTYSLSGVVKTVVLFVEPDGTESYRVVVR